MLGLGLGSRLGTAVGLDDGLGWADGSCPVGAVLALTGNGETPGAGLPMGTTSVRRMRANSPAIRSTCAFTARMSSPEVRRPLSS